jgi:hypothetical protein
MPGCKRFIGSIGLAIWALSTPAQGQEIASRLSKEIDFVSKGSSALEQLVQTAQHYQVPMGIEWVDQSPSIDPVQFAPGRRTAGDLIDNILNGMPEYGFTIDDGILHIYQPWLERDPKNFLNIRIPQFDVKDESLLGAQFLLKRVIDEALHPEKYVGPHGWGGGYGHAPDDPFGVRNISFSANDTTVRQILDRIALGNGGALWVVHLDPSTMMPGEPFYAQGRLSDGQPGGEFQWKFIHLESHTSSGPR